MGQVNPLDSYLTLSPQVQIGHVAAEVARARSWQDRKRQDQSRSAIERALEMLAVLTGQCAARGLRREALRLKEVLGQFLVGESEYQVSLAELEKYLLDLTICFTSSPRR